MYTAIDIETTGLTANDEVTIIGYADDEGYDIHYNASNGRVDEEEFEWESTDLPIVLHAHANERALLREQQKYVGEAGLNVEGNLFVGFNAEGFDFPVLRTRLLYHGFPWAYAGTSCLDIQGPFKYDFSTKDTDIRGFNKAPLKAFAEHLGIDTKSSWPKYQAMEQIEELGYERDDVTEYTNETGEEMPTKTLSTLVKIHQLYANLDVLDEHPYDPFHGKSEMCCSKWADGEIGEIIQHNLADLKMTMDLVKLVQNYVHESELRVTRF